MPWFVFIGHDGPNGPAGRKQHRPAHLERLEALAREDRIRHAGPLLDNAGEPRGSLIVFEAPDLASAENFAAGDPYVREGIFETHEVIETLAVLPN
ncbi:YciI family protein [Myxococcota bacterium]|nr:YciI family protein [Myxococcota bacterium]